MFIGLGEHLEDLEKFQPARFISRLLGMGDLFLMGVVFVVFRRQLIGLFLAATATPDEIKLHAEIVKLGAQLLIFAAIFQVFDAMGIMSGGALKGAGDTRFPLIVTVVLGVFFFVPLILLLTFTFKLGVVGAWIGATVYIFALGFVLLWRWVRGPWERINIFREKEFEPSGPADGLAPYEPGKEIEGI